MYPNPIDSGKQNHEAEMKIYTPHRAMQENPPSAVSDHAPVRIYERPFKPNQPTSPLG